ncbi:MAG: tetratricopeptide repeat protein [Anaerolineales bacterium]|nr:tetratricopeptide repeat protein [Anaerolineales bacterium]
MAALVVVPVWKRAATNLFFMNVVHLGIADERLDALAQTAPLSPSRLAWQLGTQAQARGEYSRAIDVLERAAQLEPGHPFLRYILGWAYFESGNSVAAITKWEYVGASAVLYAKGAQAEKAGQPQEAILFLESLSRVNPANSHAHYLLAYAYLRMGNPERAISEAQAAIRVDRGRNLGYRSLLARLYEQAGYHDQAYEEYLAILAISPDESSAREGLARIKKAREEKRK